MKPELSIVIPYHDRIEALNHWIDVYNQLYDGKNYEVILVDDGSEIVPDVKSLPKYIRYYRIERDPGVLNPCVPLNLGISKAKSDLLVLTNCEVIHTKKILPELHEKLVNNPNSYITCGVISDEQRWYTHSIHRPSRFHFLVGVHKNLMDQVGNYDENYRKGHSYDDADLIKKLEQITCNFIDCDDLLAIHKTYYQRHSWSPKQDAINRAYFESKWGKIK